MKKFFGTKLNNKGSGIVTVMVAIMFLSVFGSLLLMTSLAGFEMKVSDRKGKQNFYNAETAMDEILTGLQDVASDSIDDALKDSLPKYTTGGLFAQQEFSDMFKDNILNWQIKDFNGNVIKVGPDGGTKYALKLFNGEDEYKAEALAYLVKGCREGTVYINTYGDYDTVTEKESGVDNVIIREWKNYPQPTVNFKTTTIYGMEILEKVILENINVSFKNDDRENSIESSISVTVPNIVSGISDTGATSIHKFAFIAGGDLEQTDSNESKCTINGNSYMNSIQASKAAKLIFGKDDIDGKGYTHVVKDGIEISGNNGTIGEDADLAEKSRIIFYYDEKLWTRNVKVKNSAVISLLGTTRVANDLDLNGYNSSAVLKGEYFGFGTDAVNSDSSSAVLFNGLKSSLDMKDLREMYLGGYSFVTGKPDDVEGVDITNDLRMGESISARANQRAYLIKPDALSYTEDGKTKLFDTNPAVYSKAEDVPTLEADAKVKLNFNANDVIPGFEQNDEGSKTYADYGAGVKIVTKQFAQQIIAYYFVDFGSSDAGLNNANRYFRDYCKDETNKDKAKSYVDTYVAEVTENSNIKSVGDTFSYYQETVNSDVKQRFNVVPVVGKNDSAPLTKTLITAVIDRLAGYKDEFRNLCLFLDSSEPIDEADRERMYKADSTEYDDAKNPYDFYIRTDKLDKLNDTVKYYDDDGNLVAVVVPDNWTLGSGLGEDYSNLHLIVCHGDLTIADETSFNGLIFCKGDLKLKGTGTVSLNCDPVNLKKAYLAKNSEDKTISEYFYKQLYTVTDSLGDDIGSSSGILSLVKYEEWKKG